MRTLGGYAGPDIGIPTTMTSFLGHEISIMRRTPPTFRLLQSWVAHLETVSNSHRSSASECIATITRPRAIIALYCRLSLFSVPPPSRLCRRLTRRWFLIYLSSGSLAVLLLLHGQWFSHGIPNLGHRKHRKQALSGTNKEFPRGIPHVGGRVPAKQVRDKRIEQRQVHVKLGGNKVSKHARDWYNCYSLPPGRSHMPPGQSP